MSASRPQLLPNYNPYEQELYDALGDQDPDSSTVRTMLESTVPDLPTWRKARWEHLQFMGQLLDIPHDDLQARHDKVVARIVRMWAIKLARRRAELVEQAPKLQLGDKIVAAHGGKVQIERTTTTRFWVDR